MAGALHRWPVRLLLAVHRGAARAAAGGAALPPLRNLPRRGSGIGVVIQHVLNCGRGVGRGNMRLAAVGPAFQVTIVEELGHHVAVHFDAHYECAALPAFTPAGGANG